MSTTQDRGNYVFQCDSCSETLKTETSNFEAARNLLRRAGWKPYRKGGAGEWLHRCRACAGGARA